MEDDFNLTREQLDDYLKKHPTFEQDLSDFYFSFKSQIHAFAETRGHNLLIFTNNFLINLFVVFLQAVPSDKRIEFMYDFNEQLRALGCLPQKH